MPRSPHHYCSECTRQKKLSEFPLCGGRICCKCAGNTSESRKLAEERKVLDAETAFDRFSAMVREEFGVPRRTA